MVTPATHFSLVLEAYRQVVEFDLRELFLDEPLGIRTACGDGSEDDLVAGSSAAPGLRQVIKKRRENRVLLARMRYYFQVTSMAKKWSKTLRVGLLRLSVSGLRM